MHEDIQALLDSIPRHALGYAAEPPVAACEVHSPPPPCQTILPWQPLTLSHADLQCEVIVDRNGQPRQAGADVQDGEAIREIRRVAERDLFFFSKGIIGRQYLTAHLHKPVCDNLQKAPPYRKLLLMPREHAKTSIVAHCLPLHILIQPAEGNVYFPGHAGTEQRIMLAGESERRSKSNLRVIATNLESNKLLRALWPSICWDAPRRQSKKWSDEAIILPRENEYPDPTVFAIGVGGAVTGARPTVEIKDDLISFEAANSDVVMQGVIEWHKVSRALMEEYEKETGQESLEYVIGTRWAVHDLYSYIIENDPTMDVTVRAIVEDGKPIWPERFNAERVEQLRTEYGATFYLLYMNTAADPELTDFNVELVRDFSFAEDGKLIVFSEDSRDARLRERIERGEGAGEQPAPRGQLLNAKTWPLLLGESKGRGEFLRLRYS